MKETEKKEKETLAKKRGCSAIVAPIAGFIAVLL